MNEIVKEFAAQIQAGNMAKAVKPPSEQTLKEAMMAELYPGMKLDNVGKLKKQAYIDAYRNIMVEDSEDDLIPDEEEDYADVEGGADPAFPE
jgi:hypothetical protein